MSTDSNGYLVVRWVHVFFTIVVTLMVWLLTAGMIYGTMRTQLDDARERIHSLEEQHFIPGGQGVTKDQFVEFENNIVNRLDRIEQKVDKH